MLEETKAEWKNTTQLFGHQFEEGSLQTVTLSGHPFYRMSFELTLVGAAEIVQLTKREI